MISSEARQRRGTAAEKYKPAAVDLLLVAEAPPNALDRYFYFDDVTEQDSLFRYVSKSILGEVPDRNNKSDALMSVRDAGVFLIDVKEESGRPSAADVSDLVERCRTLSPRRIVLIKVTVYDLVFAALKRAGLPVVDERIPFPGSGTTRIRSAANESWQSTQVRGSVQASVNKRLTVQFRLAPLHTEAPLIPSVPLPT